MSKGQYPVQELQERAREQGFVTEDNRADVQAYMNHVVAHMDTGDVRNALASILGGLAQRNQEQAGKVLVALDTFADWELERMLDN